MTRRLRLALLLAALAVAGPMPSVRVLDGGRLDVSITWVRSERAVRETANDHGARVPDVAVARGFNPHPAPRLSPALLSHSLFQRPPPLRN